MSTISPTYPVKATRRSARKTLIERLDQVIRTSDDLVREIDQQLREDREILKKHGIVIA